MKKIPLTQGQFALVDNEDFEELNKFKWYAWWSKSSKSFYALRNIGHGRGNRTTVSMHRVIMNAKNGEVVDHIKHNTIDNRKSELRLVNSSQNGMNKRGVKGVYSCNNGLKWRVKIEVNKKQIHLGYFNLKSDAVKARKEAEVKYFGKFSYENSIQKGEN